eukprot:2306546-Pyramimonas_sp.AAC.1
MPCMRSPLVEVGRKGNHGAITEERVDLLVDGRLVTSCCPWEGKGRGGALWLYFARPRRLRHVSASHNERREAREEAHDRFQPQHAHVASAVEGEHRRHAVGEVG